MKALVKYSIFVLLCLFLNNCTALYKQHYDKAKEYYSKNMNNYAISYCLLSLKENPDYEETHILLEKSYEECIRDNLYEISVLMQNKPEFYWDNVYSYLYSNIQFNNQILNSGVKLRGSLSTLIRGNNFLREIKEAKTNAAEDHYRKGLELSRYSGTDNQKAAAKQFSAAMQYIPDYKDAEEWYKKCKRKGITRIAIIPFEDITYKRGNYGGISDRIVDEIVSLLLNDTQASEFIELITRAELEKVIDEQSISRSSMFDPKTAIRIGRILGVHEIIVGKITQIIYSPEKVSKRSYNESTEVIVGERTVGRYKDGTPKKEPIFRTVKVRVTAFKKTSRAQINGSFNIIEVVTGRIKKSNSCNGKASFMYEYGRYSGDERALSYTSKLLCDKDEEFAPVEEQMVSDASGNLSRNLFSFLREYTE